jgi:proteasome lid subunit RPN8/RPN11
MDEGILTNKSWLKWRSNCEKYTVLIAESCLLKMTEMAQEHYPNEVGTSLVGCYSNDGFEASVLDLAPLSPDSEGWLTSFYRGTTGLRKFFKKLRQTFSGKRYYVGEWHSHPDAVPIPSGTDDRNQLAIAKDTKTNCPECILIIIGGRFPDFNEIGVFVYSRKRGKVTLFQTQIEVV